MDESDKHLLLELAREAIDTNYRKEEPDINDYLHLDGKKGVFVTLHKHEILRGCIGFIESDLPLYKSIIEAARSAAFNDTRFPAVTKDELRTIKIEVSVLTKPELIEVDDSDDYKRKINLGEDGLIIRGEDNSGLLLPQVAVENNFTVVQFLNALSQKAGMSFNAWGKPENEIYKFQAEIFSE